MLPVQSLSRIGPIQSEIPRRRDSPFPLPLTILNHQTTSKRQSAGDSNFSVKPFGTMGQLQ
jgi:hypothetical protein